MRVKIEPTIPKGEIFAVASKSDAHRAIICSALADVKTAIHISHISKDIEATLNCIKKIGADFIKKDDTYEILPIKERLENPILDCGESGSTLRFLLPVLSALGTGATFVGHGRLPERPMSLIIDLLKSHGNEFSSDKLPITVSGKTKAGTFCIAGNVSSQFISGLLFALPQLSGKSKIQLTSNLESSAYVDMTLSVLKKFGADIEYFGDEFLINPTGLYKSPKEYIVEGDWSNAAFFMVMAALGGEITIKNLNLDSFQSDTRILDILKLSGVNFDTSKNAIRIYKSKIMPFDYDVSQCPDLFPIISILACGADGKSTLYNAKRLRIKESDRITTTKELILNLGGMAEETEDSLTIYGKGKLCGGVVNSANDHRIAMSAFAASVISDREIVLEGAEAMDKSYPSFIDDFRSLGGMTSVI